MLDVAIAYNRYRFLGCEFLTWLWFCIDTERNHLSSEEAEDHDLAVGNRIVLENRLHEQKETITIAGDAANLDEARLAVRKGALVSEINLVFSHQSSRWQFSIKGESLTVTGLQLPNAKINQGMDEADLDARILERLYLWEKPLECIDRLFSRFVRLRLDSSSWHKEMQALKQWVQRDTGHDVQNRDFADDVIG